MVVGLTVGKPVGIYLFSRAVVTLGWARLPPDLSWPMLLAAGFLAGIGFTMSLFIGQLALADDALEAAKLGVLIASLASGVIGMGLLRVLSQRRG